MSDVRRGPGSADDGVRPAAVAQPSAGRLQISFVQVLASSLAAVSAAVVCSFFGVAGTIVGTAVASACATVGSALYAHSLRRTQERLRTVPVRHHRPATVSQQPAPEPAESVDEPGLVARLRSLPWRWVALAAAGVFVLSAALITLIEAGAGSSLASMLGGTNGQSGGTFAPINGSSHSTNQPTPGITPTTTAIPTTAPPGSTPTPTSPAGGTTTPSSSPTAPQTSPTDGGLSSLLEPGGNGTG